MTNCSCLIVPTSVIINPHPLHVGRGQTPSLQFSATVLPAGASQAVTWAIYSIVPSSSGISISANGILTVGAGVSVGTEITVIATAVNHSTVSNRATVTVIYALPTGIAIYPQSVTLRPGEDVTFTVTVSPPEADPNPSVRWMITSPPDGVTVTHDGTAVTVTATSGATSGTIELRATIHDMPLISGEVTVTIEQ